MDPLDNTRFRVALIVQGHADEKGCSKQEALREVLVRLRRYAAERDLDFEQALEQALEGPK